MFETNPNLQKNQQPSTLSFADDQVTISDTEDMLGIDSY